MASGIISNCIIGLTSFFRPFTWFGPPELFIGKELNFNPIKINQSDDNFGCAAEKLTKKEIREKSSPTKFFYYLFQSCFKKPVFEEIEKIKAVKYRRSLVALSVKKLHHREWKKRDRLSCTMVTIGQM